MIKYLVFEEEERPKGMNVCGVKGWRSNISMSNNFCSFEACDVRNFRGEHTNIFITGFAGTLLGERG